MKGESGQGRVTPSDVRRAVGANAISRGRRAELLAAVDWEALLPRPLDEVRRRLGVDEPVPYRKLEFAEARRIRERSPVVRALQRVLPA